MFATPKLTLTIHFRDIMLECSQKYPALNKWNKLFTSLFSVIRGSAYKTYGLVFMFRDIHMLVTIFLGWGFGADKSTIQEIKIFVLSQVLSSSIGVFAIS